MKQEIRLLLLGFVLIEIVIGYMLFAPSGVMPGFLQNYEDIIGWAWMIFNIFVLAYLAFS